MNGERLVAKNFGSDEWHLYTSDGFYRGKITSDELKKLKSCQE